MSRLRVRACGERGQQGFSLVELLVVIGLLAVVGGIVTTSVVAGLTASRRGQARVYALTDLETAGQRVAREARAAQPIIAADDGLLDLTVYRNDGRFRFRYELVGDELRETRTWFETATTTVPAWTYGPRPLISDLDQAGVPVFTYYRADGSSWSVGDPPSQIARTQIRFRRDLPEHEPIEVETSVYVRNSA